MTRSDVKGPNPMVMTHAVAQVTDLAHECADVSLVPTRSVRKPTRETRPHPHLFGRDHLMPEPKGHFRDDLISGHRLRVLAYALQRSVKVRKGEGVAPTSPRVAAQFTGIVEDPMPVPAQLAVPQRQSLVDRVAQRHFDVTQGYPNGRRQLGVPLVELGGTLYIASARRKITRESRPPDERIQPASAPLTIANLPP